MCGQVVQINPRANGNIEGCTILPPFQFTHQDALCFAYAVAIFDMPDPLLAEIVATGETVLHFHILSIAARHLSGSRLSKM